MWNTVIAGYSDPGSPVIPVEIFPALRPSVHHAQIAQSRPLCERFAKRTREFLEP